MSVPRGYRGVIIAAVGWLILSAGQHPEDVTDKSKTNSTSEIENIANAVASAIIESQKSVEKDSGCNKGKDKRDSDLCAQWKAADASADAADYTWITLWISTVGTLLLVWTLWETRANARRELRAYISVKIEGFEIIEVKPIGVRIKFKIKAHNGGATPAYSSNTFGTFEIHAKETAEKILKNVRSIEKSSMNGGVVIHAGEDHFISMEPKIIIENSAIESFGSSNACIYIFGVSTYIDTFGYFRRTDFCNSIDGKTFLELIENAKSSDGQAIEAEWNVTDFHNEAT